MKPDSIYKSVGLNQLRNAQIVVRFGEPVGDILVTR